MLVGQKPSVTWSHKLTGLLLDIIQVDSSDTHVIAYIAYVKNNFGLSELRKQYIPVHALQTFDYI